MGVSGNQTLYNLNYGNYSASASLRGQLFLSFEYSEEIDIKTNKSLITVDVYLNHYALYISGRTIRVHWNDIRVDTLTSPYISYGGSNLAKTKIGTSKFEVQHDVTGDAVGTIRIEWDASNLQYGDAYITEVGASATNIQLTKISRIPPVISDVAHTESKLIDKVVAGKSTTTVTVTVTPGDVKIEKYSLIYNGGEIAAIETEGASATFVATLPDIQESSFAIPYEVRVYDEAGNVVSQAFEVTAYKYSSGLMSNKLSRRCDSEGTPDEEGTKARLEVYFTNSTIGDESITTYVKAAIGTNESEGQSESPFVDVIDTYLSPSRSYSVTYTLYDGIGEYSITDTISIAFFTMDFAPGGHGVSVGKRAEEGKFQIENMDGYYKGTSFMLLAYPVGSVYMTEDDDFDPNEYFGGTWVKIEGKFLYATSGDETAKQTGGKEKYTIQDLPSETLMWSNDGRGNSYLPTGGSTVSSVGYIYGSGSEVSLLPPYYTVHIWRRTR